MRYLLCFPRWCCLAVLLGAGVMWARPADAFSALTHQAVVDSCWEQGVVPALERSYPGATAAQLREARAYAYGGALLQDLGYFPGNTALFSNVTHYVRPGDFVCALLSEAHDRNELAFALGALAHYVADAHGHPAGTNAVTHLVFPELGPRLGSPITYAEAPRQHAQVEYAFDVAQVQNRCYRSEAFHAAIGLRVSVPVLERAFRGTYGLALEQVLPHTRPGLAAFRLVAAELLPAAVRASEYLPPGQLRQLTPADRTRYYERINSGRFRRRGGPRPNHLRLGMRLLVVLAPALPRLGIAPMLAFRPLPPAAEAAMQASFAEALAAYHCQLTQLATPLPNLNLDTGQPSCAGEYALADNTYSALARRLARAHTSVSLSPAMQQTLRSFYAANADAAKANFGALAGPLSAQTRVALLQLLGPVAPAGQ